MFISISEQTKLFLFTVLIGFGIGFVYDVFRVIRKVFKHTDYLIHLEDLIYWLFVTFMMFYLILIRNYGEIRLFSIIGSIIGMIIYFFTLSILFLKISMIIVDIIKKILCIIIKIISIPIKLIFKILSLPLNMLKKLLKIFYKSINKVLKKYKNYVKIKSNKLINNIKVIIKKV